MKKHIRKIHKTLKKRHPKAVKKAKSIFKVKYPRIILLILSIILAYVLFKNPYISSHISDLGGLSYIGIFFAGILIAFGFSAPFAVAFFIVSNPPNILLATLIGGLGAISSDYLIFKFIKFSFMNEFNQIKKTQTIRKIQKIVNKNIKIKIRHYILYIFAGIWIATPLPDEIGISMLAGLTTIKPKFLLLTSFILHAFFILLLLAF